MPLQPNKEELLRGLDACKRRLREAADRYIFVHGAEVPRVLMDSSDYRRNQRPYNYQV